MMQYPNRLHRLRMERGWHQKDVAKFVGISESSVSHYETGKDSISLKMVEKFSALYGIDSLEIFVGSRPDFECFGYAITSVDKESPPNNIKALRLTKHLSQGELSKIMKVSESIISLHESGERRIARSILHKYCKALEVTPKELVRHREDDAWKQLEIPKIPKKVLMVKSKARVEVVPLILNLIAS